MVTVAVLSENRAEPTMFFPLSMVLEILLYLILLLQDTIVVFLLLHPELVREL